MRVRISIADLLISSFLFIFVVSFPLNYFASYLPEYGILLLELCLRMFLCGYYIRLIVKYNLPAFIKPNWKNLLFCLPFLLACCSNEISFLFSTRVDMTHALEVEFIIDFFIVVFTAFNEEILFRFFIHNQLNIQNKLVKIVASAGIFAGFHLLNLVSPSFLAIYQSVLLQSVYTFGLGLILGFIYEYGKSITPCIIYHFLFNFFNSYVLNYFFFPVYEYYYIYIIVALVISIVLIGYGLLIYFLVFKKKDREYDYYSPYN